MAVILKSNDGWILSHELFTKKIYDNTKCDCDEKKSYKFNSTLFDIQVPFVKRKAEFSNSEEKTHDAEARHVNNVYRNMCAIYSFSNSLPASEVRNNQSARTLASEFHYHLTRHPKSRFHGGNNSSEPLVSKIGEELYLIPEGSLFYCYDISEISMQLKGERFDFILLDPPWWNKCIRRKRKKNQALAYDMIHDKDLRDIPIDSLLNDNGMIGVWCTNAPSHTSAVVMDLFKAWNIEFLTQWFWLKITKSGQTICAFSKSLGKQPYERIIFGKKKNTVRDVPTPDKNKVIMSIPSAIHSHKPPLCEVLKPYLPESPACLELFARYLLPNWTSYGNEVLKLQHISLYEEYLKGQTGM